MENKMDTVTDVISSLRKSEVIYDFEFADGKFICKDTGESFLPHQLAIKKIFRFEGDSSTDDMSILYYMQSSTGTKGIFVDAFGTYADAGVSDFIRQIPAD
jgi:hypothetical protein